MLLSESEYTLLRDLPYNGKSLSIIKLKSDGENYFYYEFKDIEDNDREKIFLIRVSDLNKFVNDPDRKMKRFKMIDGRVVGVSKTTKTTEYTSPPNSSLFNIKIDCLDIKIYDLKPFLDVFS